MIPTRVRQLLPALVLIIISVSAVLMTGELAVRFFVPSHRWAFRDAAQDWLIDPRLGWVQKPGLDVTTRTEQGWNVRFQTNGDGLTPSTVHREKEAGVLRIMIFGNSTVVGRGVPQDKTVNAYLERLLREKEVKAEVINAGVQGYSTDQALLRMKQLYPLYQPDVIIYGMCDNDFGGNVSSSAYEQAKPRFRFKSDGTLEEIPPSLGKRIKPFGNGPAKWLQFSALYRLLQPGFFNLRARVESWEGRNLMGAAPEIYYNLESLNRIDWVLFSALVKEMKRVAEEHQAQFFFYSHPAIAEVWDPYIQDAERRLKLAVGQYDRYALERRLQQVQEETGAPFVPLIRRFAERQSEGPFHLLPRDPHANETGNRLVAERLSEELLRFKEEQKPL